jgi:hypothetical protein
MYENEVTAALSELEERLPAAQAAPIDLQGALDDLRAAIEDAGRGARE